MCFIPCCIALCFAMCWFEIGASYARKLGRAKTNARRARAGLPPHFTVRERFRMWRTATFNFYVGRWVCPWRIYGWHSTKVPYLFRTGTIGSQILISTKYFVYGCLFATLWFFLMAFHLNYSCPTAFIIAVFLGFVFGIGMAFNVAMRCVVHLTLPQIFSTKGRSLLLSYVFIMVMTHPLTNFQSNLEVMSSTITCGQQLAVNSTKALAKAAAGPVIDLLKDIRGVLNSIKGYVGKLKDAFMAVKRMFQQVADAMVAAKEWLKNNANVCGNEMGTPFHKCQQTFVDVKWSCVNHMRGVGFGFLSGVCNVAEWGKVVCYLLKGIDKMCEATDAAKTMVKDKVAKPVKKAIERVKNTFYFSVEIDYHYNVTLKQSQTAAEILRKVRAEVKARLQPLLVFKHWTSFWMTVMLMLVIFKAHRYRKLYLTREGFDNFYLVQEIEDIDNARRTLNKDRVYPMPKREYLRYALPGSPLLTIHEFIKLGKGLIFFCGTLFQVILFICLDFLLYCILYLIQKYGHIEVDQTVPSHSMLHIQGSGILADIYRALISQFDPMKKPMSFSLDTSSCLPHPTEPNWKIYKTIGIVMLFCFVSVMCQPYFARMRHNIAHRYYPKRRRQRALWLYNNILMRRGTVMFFVRRQVRQLFQKEENDDANDLMAVLAAKCGLFAHCLRLAGVKYKYCASCGTSGKEDDMEKFRHCQQYDCNTCYCLRCYVELGNVCTACMAACDYGDLEDVSDEMDSSDEEGPKPSISQMIQMRLDEERGSLPSSSSGGGGGGDNEGWIQSYSDAHSSYIAWSDAADVTGFKSESGESMANLSGRSLSGARSLKDSLLGDPGSRVVVLDPSGGIMLSRASLHESSRLSQGLSRGSIDLNSGPSSITHRSLSSSSKSDEAKPGANENTNSKYFYRQTINNNDKYPNLNSTDTDAYFSASDQNFNTNNNDFRNRSSSKVDVLNRNQHNINRQGYDKDLEQSSELLWTLPGDRVPTRPIVELVSPDIFEIIDDLKDRFVWKTDWLEHGIGHDGVAWWEGSDDNGEVDDDSGPDEQWIERQ